MSGTRILFIRLRSLGDTVLMTPALALAKRRPDCEVGVVVERPFHELLQHHPDVDCLITAERRASVWERTHLIRRVRRFGADVAVDLHGGTTAALLTAFSGAAIRVGYQASRNSWAYNRKTPASAQLWGKTGVHTVEHQVSPLKYLGYDCRPLPPLRVEIGDAERERAASLLESARIQDGFVLMHLAAAFETKQWPVERFAELAIRLSGEGSRVVATAGPGEESLVEAFRQLVPPEVKTLPPLRIRDYAALVSHCGIYVGNDTGPTHVAAACGKPVVAIFGSSNDQVWYPWGVPHRILRADYPCIPCPGYHCLHYERPECILSIAVERVHEAVRSLMR